MISVGKDLANENLGTGAVDFNIQTKPVAADIEDCKFPCLVRRGKRRSNHGEACPNRLRIVKPEVRKSRS
jgi:hypothetical protein